MDIIDCLRAKSEDGKKSLLKEHLKETIERAVQLRRFVNENRDAIAYPKFNEEFFEKLVIACFLHDLGKINYNFQKEVCDKGSREFNQIESFFDGYRRIDVKDHEVVSVIFSSIFLGNDEWDKEIRTAVLLHHYNEFYTNSEPHIRNILDDYPDLKVYIEFLSKNKEKIKQLLKNLLGYLSQEITDGITKKILRNLEESINFERIEKLNEGIDNGFGISTNLKLLEIPDKEDDNFYDFFVFLGCLRRCDYSASGEVSIEKEVNICDVFNGLEDEIKEAIGKVAGRNEIWQEELLKNNDLKNKNIVLIAPTGSGKTEFALLWAKRNDKKLIYTIPLRVALNDLLRRFGGNSTGGYFDKSHVDILHSTSFLEYIKKERDIDIDEQTTSARLFSSPIMLTTPDQALLSSLKFYGFDKLVSVYPTSSIVIDEIQAYKPEMMAVIIKTLEIVRKLGSNVLIITATFPPYLQEFLNETSGFEKIDLKNEKSKLKCKIKNYELKRHRIKLIYESLFKYEKKESQYELKIDEGLEEIKKLVKDHPSKNIIIVVNNVGKAIELFKKMEEDGGVKQRVYIKAENEEIPLLLHSRIIEKEKSKRIAAIKKALENKNFGVVVVATQIVEASVDYDFDILITEISPIDSQIQRWGRIYRNRVLEYQGDHPNIFIFVGEEDEKDGSYKIDKGTSAIYDERVIGKTIKILKEQRDEVLDYEKERELIGKIFEEKLEGGRTLKEEYKEEIKENLEWLELYSAEKRSEAQRIFRRMAGIQVIILDLMKEGDEMEKAVYEVIKEKNNRKLPIESEKASCILEKAKERLSNDELRKQINKWKIFEILYSYSTNVPISGSGSLDKFKGFLVMEGMKEDEISEIKKVGMNKIKKDLDVLEIEEAEII